jgi:hypothetical protein
VRAEVARRVHFTSASPSPTFPTTSPPGAPQSPQGNDLDIAPPGGAANHVDNPVPATAFPITMGGAKAYAFWFTGGQGYRRDVTKGIATGKCVMRRRRRRRRRRLVGGVAAHSLSRTAPPRHTRHAARRACSDPETLYMIVNGNIYNGGCCFD